MASGVQPLETRVSQNSHNPSMPVTQPPQILQTSFTEQTTDLSSTPTAFTYVTFMTVNVTFTGWSVAEVHFSVSQSNSAAFGAGISYRITIDGTSVVESTIGTYDSTNAQSLTLRYKSGVLSAGSHTFDVDWNRDTGTNRIRPATQVHEHASLLIKEMVI